MEVRTSQVSFGEIRVVEISSSKARSTKLDSGAPIVGGVATAQHCECGLHVYGDPLGAGIAPSISEVVERKWRLVARHKPVSAQPGSPLQGR